VLDRPEQPQEIQHGVQLRGVDRYCTDWHAG
jgi:hypothetical protein